MKKDIYILGISESHTATAALLKNGEIIACASEERFTRKKLQAGIPTHAINFCLNFAKIKTEDLTMVAAADIEPPFLPPFESPYTRQKPPFPILMEFFFNFEERLEQKFPQSQKFFYGLYKRLIKFRLFKRQRERLQNLQKILPLPKAKFTFFTHHTCHGTTALFSSKLPNEKKPILIITCDGVGDFESATISKFDNGKFTKLSSISFQQSLGFFYQHVTQYLGLKPIEDEYKVMGLAPYVNQKKAESVYKILIPYFKINKSQNKWHIKVSEYHIWRKLPKLLRYRRFDHIASAVQRITEEILTQWVKNAIQNYKIGNIVFGGGVFANVKINQKIATLKEVRRVFFMPSPGDESNAIGAAYYCYYHLTNILPKPLEDLYLGPAGSSKEILKSKKSLSAKFKIEKPKNLNFAVAKLLAQGHIVARFTGRMEFGARALGNRSILANPKEPQINNSINFAIKSRDFWMPFAPTILRERAKDYLVGHKADSQFMNVAYNTTQLGQRDLAFAIHPYDKTTRPQILDRHINANYYDLVKKFENLTGIGAVLNTSFNLHGEPIVCTPDDAVRVFKLSGLKFLAMENWLIIKK